MANSGASASELKQKTIVTLVICEGPAFLLKKKKVNKTTIVYKGKYVVDRCL